LDKIPGPETIPILGAALKFSPDSESVYLFEFQTFFAILESTYQMERYFRIFTEDRQNSGLMRLQLGPKRIIIVYKAETIKVSFHLFLINECDLQTVLESSILTSKPTEYDFMSDWLGEGLLTR
jgi:hypothetical protein